MKKSIVIILILLGSVCAFAQNPDLTKEWKIVKRSSQIPFISIEFFKPLKAIKEGIWASEGQLYNAVDPKTKALDQYAIFAWMVNKSDLILYISFSVNNNFKKEDTVTIPYKLDKDKKLHLKWKDNWYVFE